MISIYPLEQFTSGPASFTPDLRYVHMDLNLFEEEMKTSNFNPTRKTDKFLKLAEDCRLAYLVSEDSQIKTTLKERFVEASNQFMGSLRLAIKELDDRNKVHQNSCDTYTTRKIMEVALSAKTLSTEFELQLQSINSSKKSDFKP